jgi:formylglycine-generating enzyme required for sulfatase activity
MELSNFFRFSKYDIAISVAEEDVAVAEQIAVSFKNRKIKYYLYTEHSDNYLGMHIFKILVNVYGKNSRYVLMITSEIFSQQYWSNIELMIALQLSAKKRRGVLQLKLDNAEIEGIEKHIIHKKWNGKADAFAGIIKKILVKDWWNRFGKRLTYLLLLLLIISSFVSGVYKMQGDTDYHPNSKQMAIPYPDSADLNKKVLIPGAPFLMGYKDSSNKWAPPHYVTIDSFYISATEVTMDQYAEYCKIKNIVPPPQLYPNSPGDHPIVNISWFEAAAYCKWRDGRLPTEAEWEYAADAGLGHKYAGGNGAVDYAISSRARQYRVGTKKVNGFGLYDMSGNVSEWCNDWFSPDYYSSKDSINPQGPVGGSEKVVRGGSYMSNISPVNTLHVLLRSKEMPALGKPYIGFRVAWSVDSKRNKILN